MIEGDEEWLLMGTGFFGGWWKYSGINSGIRLHSSVNILITSELYTLKVSCVNYISVSKSDERNVQEKGSKFDYMKIKCIGITYRKKSLLFSSTHIHNTSDTISSNSVMTAKCSTIHFSSHTVSLIITSHRLRTQSPFPTSGCQLQVQVVTDAADQLAINQRFPRHTSLVHLIC